MAGASELTPVPIDGTLVKPKTDLQLFDCDWIEQAVEGRHNELCVGEEAEIG